MVLGVWDLDGHHDTLQVYSTISNMECCVFWVQLIYSEPGTLSEDKIAMAGMDAWMFWGRKLISAASVLLLSNRSSAIDKAYAD